MIGAYKQIRKLLDPILRCSLIQKLVNMQLIALHIYFGFLHCTPIFACLGMFHLLGEFVNGYS